MYLFISTGKIGGKNKKVTFIISTKLLKTVLTIQNVPHFHQKHIFNNAYYNISLWLDLDLTLLTNRATRNTCKPKNWGMLLVTSFSAFFATRRRHLSVCCPLPVQCLRDRCNERAHAALSLRFPASRSREKLGRFPPNFVQRGMGVRVVRGANFAIVGRGVAALGRREVSRRGFKGWRTARSVRSVQRRDHAT